MLSRPRHRRTVGEEVRRIPGTNLRVMRYKIPEPGYRTQGCLGPLDRVDHRTAVEVLWHLALESEHFAAILDALVPGCAHEIRADHAFGLNWQGRGGRDLEQAMRWCVAQALQPALLRAADIRSTRDRDLFLAALRDPNQWQAMALACSLLPTRRDKVAERELGGKFRSWGLRLRPHQQKTGDSFHRRQLLRLITGTAGGSGGG